MSIDRCKCGAAVDTDFDVECYADQWDGCLCECCREGMQIDAMEEADLPSEFTKEKRAELAKLQAETLCWKCNKVYLRTDAKCPQCGATNANADFETAQAEMMEAA